MKNEGYDFEVNSSCAYTFISTGSNGNILKLIYFQEVSSNSFNLVLADRDELNDGWSDMVNSNNGDIAKIFKTVISCILLFLENNPEAVVYIEANSLIKNKLYNRIIKNYHLELTHQVSVWGIKNGKSYSIEIGNEYESFYICKTKS